MDLSSIHSAYLIGIKGVGMTALAQILRARGIRVSGSDTAQQFFTDSVLRRAGIPFTEGFTSGNVPAADLILRSTAYGEENAEVAEAMRRGLPMATYPEAVGMVFNAGKGIAICGTHGKTTTTAMLGYVLQEAGLDPTVIVGSEVPQFGGNARVGAGELVILEADEYQDKFQHYAPFGVILTNIEYDHPDYFPTSDAYIVAFRRFVSKIPADGFLVACADDPTVMAVSRDARCAVIPYGFAVTPDARVETLLPGRHNTQNALAVLTAAERLGVSRNVALRAIASFKGTKRRFEVIGEVNGITVIDDYGHHPTEIRVTLAAVRERYPDRRILCVFHAHTFTRTIALKEDFARAFVGADQTYAMDIYGSAREQHGGITAAELAAMISTHSPAQASGGVEETVAALVRDAQPGDVILCIGAGENDRVARGVVDALAQWK